MAGDITFNCLKCGAPIPVHAAGQSLSFGCRSCGAVVEEDHRGLRILRQASQAMRWKPLLELGSKAQFRGETWQVLGFMVRSDASEEYFWNEYLLFNPYLGFRWLMEAQGHWNFLHMTRHRPSAGLGTSITWGGHRYRLFLKGRARVQFVLGEFYWRVKIGDEVTVRDYVAPPDILSSEEDGTEEIWSAGVYVEPEDVQKSFKINGPMPARVGVAPNQPSRYRERRSAYLKHWGFFVALLVGLHFILGGLRDEKTVMESYLVRQARVPVEGLRSESFMIDEDETNVRIRIHAPVSRGWMHVRFTLIGEDGQLPAPIEFGREFHDSYGGETQTTEEVFLRRLSRGRYRLDMLTEGTWENVNSVAAQQSVNIYMKVIENAKVISPLVLCIILASLIPLGFLLGDWRFETKRWADSDVNG